MLTVNQEAAKLGWKELSVCGFLREGLPTSSWDAPSAFPWRRLSASSAKILSPPATTGNDTMRGTPNGTQLVDALNLVRSGKGKDAAEALRNLVEFAPTLDTHFDGTTLVSKNSEVDRFNEQRRLPDALTKREKQLRQRGPGAHVHYSKGRRRWILGSVTYYPLRLAYASTVHKSQGLSLDRVQVDCRARFFGSPAMAYVSVSRARTPEGLRIVGTPEKFAKAGEGGTRGS